MEEKDTKKSTQGKGKGKNKKQTINLNEFINAGSPAAGFTAVPVQPVRWSEVCDDDDNEFSGSKNQADIFILPNAPKSARGPDIDINQVPTQPPFICYLSNLPFEATEDDVLKFFKDLKVSRVDLSKDPSMTNPRSRGQGLCEFPDRDTLIDAFRYNNDTIKNRPIRLSLFSYDAERKNYGRERDNDKEDRTAGDWRSNKSNDDKPRFTPNRSYADSNHFGNRSRDNNYNNRNTYNRDNSYDNRSSYNNRNQSNRNSDNNYSNQDSESDGYKYLAKNLDSNLKFTNQNDEPPKERPKLNLAKPTNRRIEQQPTLPLNQERNENDANSESTSRRTSESEKPEVRKKLVLLPKSKNTENTDSVNQPVKTNPSIFGEAKPVDTTKRLQEIESKLQEKVIDEKEVENLIEKPLARDMVKRLSDSSSHASERHSVEKSFERSNYNRDNRQDRGNNRFDNGGYRKNTGNRNNNRRDDHKLNTTGNRNENSNYNRDNRDNRFNKYNNNNRHNNNWNNNDYIDKRSNDFDQERANRTDNRFSGNRQIVKPEVSLNQKNKFSLLKEEMD